MPFVTMKEISDDKRAIFDRLVSKSYIPKYVLGRNKYAESVAGQISVQGFVDDYTSDSTYLGKPILKLDELPPNCVVVSCVVDARPVTALNRLKHANVRDVIDYFSLTRLQPEAFRPIAYSSGNRRDLLENEGKYVALHARLADERSRETLRQITQFRFTADLDCMRSFAVALDTQYFDDFVNLQAGEVFVDGGGFDGQTTLRFADRCPDYAHVFYFEPNPQMMAVSQLRLCQLRNVTYMTKGLFSRRDNLRFDTTASSASHLSETGDITIPATCLDEEVESPITYLKLDVEGAECDALLGSTRHIAQDRARLAVCVYHDQTHFWRVPEIVLGINDRYDVYLRHYTEGILETVMYFMPR